MIEDVTTKQKEGYYEKILHIIFLSIVFLTPIFFIPLNSIPTQFWTSTFFAIGALLAILVYVSQGLKTGSVYLPTRKSFGFFIFIIPVVYLLSGLLNGPTRMNFIGYTFDIGAVGFIALSFTFIFLVSIFFNDKKRIINAQIAFLLSSIVIAVFIVSRMIFGVDFLSFGIFNKITNTTLGNWNNVGIFFGTVSILSFFSYEMLNLNRLTKFFLLFILISSFFFLAIVNFEMVWYTLVAVTFLFILYSAFGSSVGSSESFSIKVMLKKIPIVTGIIFLISLTFVIYGDSMGQYLSVKFGIENVEVRPSFTATYQIAKTTLVESPFLGSGPNTFLNEWLINKPKDVVNTIFWNTDFNNGVGLIPTFVITTGALGFLSWILYIGYFIYVGLKSIFQKNLDVFTKYFVVSSFFISLYLWVMMFVYVPSVAIFVLHVFFNGLFFASRNLAGMTSVERKNFVLTPKSGFVGSIVLLFVFVTSLSLAFELYKSSKSVWFFQKSAQALNIQNDVDLSEKYMIKAINLIPHDIYYRALSEIELVKLQKIVSQDTTKVSQTEIQKQFSDVLSNAIKASLSSEKANPQNYLNWISAGRVYEAVSNPEMNVENAFENAEIQYKEALRLNPYNPSIYMLLSRLSVTKGDLKKSRDYALEAIKLKRNYVDAYFFLSQIEVTDNNLPAAILSVTVASVIDPTNVGTFFQLGLLKYNSKDYAGAVLSFEKALSISPDYANAKYFLGLSYDFVGQKQKAIKEFQDLSKTNPDNIEVKNILQNLLSGKSALLNSTNSSPEKSRDLPVTESAQQ
ncbi:MAG: tetratricopeptide repeat protein [Minisyncoccia bacterium]